MLGVSISTIYRCMSKEGRLLGAYSVISDGSIDSIVRQIKEDHPNDCEVMVAEHLGRIGVRITRARLRASIHHVDPHGVVARGRSVIKRKSLFSSIFKLCMAHRFTSQAHPLENGHTRSN